MSTPNHTHYDVLGIPRDASLSDINRAHNRYRSEMEKETSVPDARRAVRVRKAVEVLSDPQQREAYDASLVVPDRKNFARKAGLAGAAVALAAVGGYFVLRPAPPVVQPARNPQDIAYWATASVGRVQRIEMSGQTLPLGLAFAVEEGVMVTSCHGLTPGSTLFVNFQPRTLPARITTASDELGLCKLAVAGVGSWPFPVGGSPARVDDKVYTVRMNAAGEVSLVDGKVKRVVRDPKGQSVETTIALPTGDTGAPLLDIYGRVIAIAHPPESGGTIRFVVAPSDWVVDTRALRRAPAPPPAPAAKADPAAPEGPEAGKAATIKSPVKISPERAQKLQEAFRPPPQVPDDL
jgi:serine protease Do